MDKIMGRAKLENMGKIIGKQAYEMLNVYLKENKTGKVAIEYEDGLIAQLEILPDNWVRYQMPYKPVKPAVKIKTENA